MENNTSFADLWLSAAILKMVEKKGFTKPSAIQQGVIPLFLSTEKDIIGQAQTGTGKTAAFGLPLLDRIDKRKKHIQAIILTPTRELAIQVAEEIKSFSDAKSVNITLLYGGQNIWQELRNLRAGPQIVVWTPGRVQDHLRKRSLIIDKVDYFILDEADEMLNVWFREEIDTILESAPEHKRVLLFSATMPRAIQDIVKHYMVDHELVAVKREELTNKNITQKCYKVNQGSKFDSLCRVIETEDHFYGIVFCRTKAQVDEVASSLMWKGYLAEWIHGDVEQKWREKILARFKAKKISVLVATDVAARWIDVNDLTHVVNYDLPDNPETYTHRIGRTGRAGKSGVAISFISRRDSRGLVYIERMIKQKIEVCKLPQADDIVKAKKTRLIENITKILSEGNLENYKELSDKLLALWEAWDVLSAILKWAYKDTFNESNYRNIREESGGNSWSVDGKTRLFIARGRNHWLDLIWVKKIIETETGIDMKPVRDVALFDEFSFMNINNEDAETILAVFKKLNKIKPLVVKAKERNGWGGWDRGGRGWYRWGRSSGWGWYRGGDRWGRSGWYKRDWERSGFRRDRWDKDRRG